MKKLIAISATVVLMTGCGGADGRPLSATCSAAVNVTVPRVTPARQKTKKPAARVPQSEIAHVYWDVSRSMREFAATRTPRQLASIADSEPWTDDLTPVVAALDSTVLLRAHAKQIEHYGVGESIRPLSTARAALQPTANRTALHLAAEQIGAALASGTAHAALVVSDLELDTPPRRTVADATVCGGVPLPSTPVAGSLFGRCFESAVVSAGDVARTRTHLVVHAFRKSTHGRELFIVLFATDRAFARRISAEIVRVLDFSRHVVFDSGAVAAANVQGCQLTAPAPAVQIRPANGCAAKCFDADAAIQAECEIRRPADDAWVTPAGRGVNGTAYESLKRGAGDKHEQARVRFAIPCNTPPGKFEANVSFGWRERTPWAQDGNGAFAQKASVRDLFDSLTDAIVRTVPPRRLRIGIGLAK